MENNKNKQFTQQISSHNNVVSTGYISEESESKEANKMNVNFYSELINDSVGRLDSTI